MPLLSFEDWYIKNEDDINIELAESGADREMDFDSELEFNNRYEKYYESFESFGGNQLQV